MDELQLAVLDIPHGSRANLELADPGLVEFYQDLSNRIYRFYGEVTEEFLELGRYIIEWNREDKGIDVEKRKPIKIMIYSPGGDLSVFFSLRQIIKMSKTPIIGVNMGEAASAAGLLYLSCPMRIAIPHAKLLLHYGQIAMSLNGKDAIEQLKSYDKELENMVEIIMKGSNLSADFIKDHLHQDWHISTSKQIEYGMTDHTISDIEELF